MRKTVIAALLSTLLPTVAMSADLLQTYRDAAANDQQFASARSSLLAGQEKLPQGRSGLLPQVSLSANTLYNHAEVKFDNPLPTTTSDFNSHGYTLSLSQPLFQWANYQLYEQSELAVSVAESQFAQAQQDLILRVTQAYFDVLGAQDTLTFTTAQKAAVTEQLASAKRNFEVGTATITDTDEAQAKYDSIVAQEIAAQSDLDVKNATLRQITGQDPGTLSKLKDKADLPPPQPAVLDTWVAASEKQNLSVAQAQLSFESAKRTVEINRGSNYPTVSLIASRSYATPETSPAQSATTNTIGVQLSVPLYTGGLVSSKVREALALQDKAQSDLEYARRSAALTARQAYSGVTSGLAQVKALEAAEKSSQSALDSNKLGYQVGVRVNIDVLNAQQQLFSTRRDLSLARYNTLISGIKLKAATATLTEEDVKQLNALLQN